MQVSMNPASMKKAEKEYSNFVKKLSDSYKISVKIDTSKFDILKSQSSGLANVTKKATTDMTQQIKMYQQNASLQLDKLEKKHAKVWSNPEIQSKVNTFKQNMLSMSNMSMKPQLTNDFKRLKFEIDGLAKSNLNQITHDMNNALEKFPLWIAVSTAVMGAIHKVGEAIEFVREQSELFTNFQMEMTGTTITFDSLTGKANSFAEAMSSTTSEVSKAIAVFGTYTSTMDEVLEKSEAAVIMSNISGKNIEETADDISSALNQFQLSAEDSMMIVDTIAGTARMLQVDYPKAIQEMSNGLKNFGSVAQSQGTNVQFATAMIGTLVDKTRKGGAEIGNAMRTVYTRFAKFGEEADPENFKELESTLYDLGISMKTLNGEMIPTDVVLSQLAEKWEGLTDAERNNIAELGAGTHRRNTFIALMENFQSVVKNNEAAVNSEGVAMEKNAIFAESLRGSINGLQTAWEHLYLETLSPSTMKMWVELATGIVKVIDAIGVGNIALAVFVANWGNVMKFISTLSFSRTIREVGLLTASTQALATAMNMVPWVAVGVFVMEAYSGWKRLAEQEKAATDAQTNFNKAMGEFNVTADSSQIDKMTQSLNELKTTLNVTDATKQIAELRSELEQLQEVVSNKQSEEGLGSSSRVGAIQQEITSLQRVVDMENELSEAEKRATLSNKEQSSAFEKFNSVTQNSTTGLDAIASAIQDVSTNEEFNISKVLELADKYPQLLEVLGDRKLLEEELIKIKDTQLQKTVDTLNAEISALTADLQVKKNIYQAEIDMLAQVAQARRALSSPEGNTGTSDQFRALMSEQKMGEISAGQARGGITSIEQRLNAAKGALSAINTKFGKVGGGTKSTGGGASSKEKSILDNYKAQASAVADINNELTILNSKLQLSEGDDRIDAQNAIIEATKRHQEALRAYNTELRKIKNPTEEVTAEMEKNSQAWWADQVAIKNATDAIKDYNKEAQDLIEQNLSDEIDKTTKAFDKMSDVIDKSQEKYEARMDKRIQRYQDELDALEAKNAELDDEAERQKMLLEIEEARAKLANVKAEKNVRLYTGQGETGFEWVADPSAVADATESLSDLETQLAEYDVDMAQKAAEEKLQAKIDALEDEKAAEVKKFQERKEALKNFQTAIEEKIAAHEVITDAMMQEYRDLLTSKEQSSYETRLEDLREFVDNYNTILGNLGNTKSSKTSTKKATTSGGTGGNTKSTISSTVQARAIGGPVESGQTYQVNELGMESMLSTINGKDYLTPLTSGRILTAPQTSKALSGASGDVFNISNITLPNVQNAQDFASEMKSFIVQSNRFSKSRG